MKYLITKSTLTGFLGIFLVIFAASTVATAQEQEKRIERKVEIKKSVSGEGTSIQLKVEKEDGSVYEKTYSSREEMENDPELADMDIHLGGDVTFFDDESGAENFDKIIRYRSNFEEEGPEEFRKEGNVWIQELEPGDEEQTFVFKSNTGDVYMIEKGKDGDIRIKENGEELNQEGKVKVNVDEEGTITITDGENISKMKIGEGGKSFFFNEGGGKWITKQSDGGQGIFMFKGDDGKEVTFERLEDLMWEGDSSGNLFIVHEDPDGDPEGAYEITVDVEKNMDGEGNEQVTIKKQIGVAHVEISDISNPKEYEKIPGVHLNQGPDLNLEDVNYYPNPNSGQFTLQFKGEQKPVDIKIVDMTGQEIYRETINEFPGYYDKEINLSQYDPGIYILQVVQNDRSWSKKIVLE